jgi:hypothetical protein
MRRVFLMEINEIVIAIKKGILNRDIDEKYAGGFWDLSLEITKDYDDIDLVEKIYNILWGLYETL